MNMNWTPDDTRELLTLKENVDSDDIRIKEKIKEVLLNNRYLLHVIDNKDLEELVDEDGTGADEYYGVNILPNFIVNPTQHSANTFICYEVGYNNINRALSTRSSSNRLPVEAKEIRITFEILSNYKVLINQDTGIAKHDLLAALIIDQFNMTNYFGKTLFLIADEPSVVDNDFACRTLTFGMITDNNLVKTIDGVPRFANKIKGAHFVDVE